MENSVAAAKSLQSCPTLCDAIDGSPPGSPVPEIFQARTLAWVAIASSNAWKWKVKVKSLSCVWLLATPWTAAYQVPPSMRFLGKSTGVGCHCLLREEQCGDSCKKKWKKNSHMAQQSHCWAYTPKTRIERDTCTPVFIVALFTIARTWKQPRCPSADKWIRKQWYIYTMEYYSAIKNAFESILMRWMKLKPIIQSEVS